MLTAAPVPNANTGYENFEPYVSVEKAARYLDIKPKTLLEKARKGEIPAYPWGDGTRRTWRFKISQIDEWMKSRLHSVRRPPLPEGRAF